MSGTFEQWTGRMENEYEEFKSERRNGFAGWFEKAKRENEEINSDYEAFIEFWEKWVKDKKDNRKIPKNKDVYFVSLKIAQAFYEECIEYELLIKRDTEFASGKKYAQAIKNYFEKGIVLNKDGLTDKNTTLYWIDLCSAMQMHYKIFNNLSDVNKFLTGVAAESKDTDEELMNYGLYVRDLVDLCIAFSILHGKSSIETKILIAECVGTVNMNKNVNKKDEDYCLPQTQPMLSRYNGMVTMSEESFKYMVKDDAKFFLPSGNNRHLTTVSEVINEIIKYNNGKGRVDLQSINLNSYDSRVELINKVFKRKIFKLNLKEMNYSALTVYLADRLGIEYGKKEENVLKWSEITPINDALRSLYILTMMRSIYEEVYYDTSEDFSIFKFPLDLIKELNKKLSSVCLREIEYLEEGETIKNVTTDKFDWFIIECIKRDKACCDNGFGISGFKPFCDFMELDED